MVHPPKMLFVVLVPESQVDKTNYEEISDSYNCLNDESRIYANIASGSENL